MLVLIATFQAKPGKEKALEEKLKAVIPNVQDEDGTIMYIVNRSVNDPGKFLIYEIYKDKLSLDIHGSTPSFIDLIDTIDQVAVGKPQISFYEDIASIRR